MFYRLEEWDKSVDEYKEKIQRALGKITSEDIEKHEAEKKAGKKAKNSKKGTKVKRPVREEPDPEYIHQKNKFRYSRADFRQSACYEKCKKYEYVILEPNKAKRL